MRRATAAFALAAVVALTAGCGPVPQPFRPEIEAPPNPLLDVPDVESLHIPPVAGTTRPMGDLLAQAAADALGARDVPATTHGAKAPGHLLPGRVEYGDDGRPRGIRWRLLDPAGKPVAEHVEPIPGEPWQWDYGDPRILRVIGQGVAAAIAPIVRPDDPTVTPADPEGPFQVWMGRVEGAPGDGNQALARAMRTAMRVRGVAFADSEAAAAAVLEGRVEVGPARGGGQPVSIVWALRRADGARIGEAAQSNAVPAGSLDGAWGEVAGYAVQAAADGVHDLIEGAARSPRDGGDENSGRPALEIPWRVPGETPGQGH